MELSGNLIKESIKEMSSLDALIFPEITIGNSIVAKGRRFERLGLYRSLYFEAPRMIRKDVFFEVGGYNPRLNAFEYSLSKFVKIVLFSVEYVILFLI